MVFLKQVMNFYNLVQLLKYKMLLVLRKRGYVGIRNCAENF